MHFIVTKFQIFTLSYEFLLQSQNNLINISFIERQMWNLLGFSKVYPVFLSSIFRLRRKKLLKFGFFYFFKLYFAFSSRNFTSFSDFNSPYYNTFSQFHKSFFIFFLTYLYTFYYSFYNDMVLVKIKLPLSSQVLVSRFQNSIGTKRHPYRKLLC